MSWLSITGRSMANASPYLSAYFSLSSFAGFYNLISALAKAEPHWKVEAETQHY